MAKIYYPKNAVVQAEVLTEENWDAVAELLGDRVGPDKIRKVYLTEDLAVREEKDNETTQLGLWIPGDGTLVAPYVAYEGNYIFKDAYGNVSYFKPEAFENLYMEVTDA